MLRIENAADHLEDVAHVARWHWEAWGYGDPGGSAEAWVDALRKKTNRDEIPLTLLAYADGRLAGSASLIDHDMADRADLAGCTPWVAGVYVDDSLRGSGIGVALMTALTDEARRLGVERLYLYTARAAPFYERLGWRRESETEYKGEPVTVMSLDL
jgi:GNAT superfamily N-acetyltransferase